MTQRTWQSWLRPTKERGKAELSSRTGHQICGWLKDSVGTVSAGATWVLETLINQIHKMSWRGDISVNGIHIKGGRNSRVNREPLFSERWRSNHVWIFHKLWSHISENCSSNNPELQNSRALGSEARKVIKFTSPCKNVTSLTHKQEKRLQSYSTFYEKYLKSNENRRLQDNDAARKTRPQSSYSLYLIQSELKINYKNNKMYDSRTHIRITNMYSEIKKTGGKENLKRKVTDRGIITKWNK